MINRFIVFVLIILVLSNPILATSSHQLQNRINALSKWIGSEKLEVTPVTKEQLPTPYNFLLVQPLMTLGVEHYYHRTPRIIPLDATLNNSNNTYSRVIYMVLENQERISKQGQSSQDIVELASITINFRELPAVVVTSILKTDIPFGKILANNKIKTLSINKEYFSLQCTGILEKILHCKANNTIYGRMNTLVREDNKKWIAQVVEILSGLTSSAH